MNRTPILPTDSPPAPSAPIPAGPASPFVAPKFDALLLVCSRCAERSSGPSKRKAKKLPGEFKKALGGERPRVRIVESSCLGLCPKKATAVAAAMGDGPLRLAAVGGKSDVQAMADRLRGRR
ncbi:hypothetical protein ACSFA2_08825 [Variovorax sp. LT2P21]|uniref:hypothetical protein n=1 Tax=Variovorax sp. LT2P21 TaxID=3443731 RepID=UPI003F45D97F